MLEASAVVLALSYLAFAVLACAMARHRDDIAGGHQPDPPAAAQRRLRWAAGILLLVSLCVAIGRMGPAHGALLWSMQISLAAMLVAFTLTWRPACLLPLLTWIVRRVG